MTTDGGGWTLVAKLRGNTENGNRIDTPFWRNKNYVGDIGSLTSEDALGPSYESVGFTDVMIRSLTNANRNLGWRHPTTYPSMSWVVSAGQRISDGVKRFGSVSNLDYTGSASVHNDCSLLKYGFFGFDSTQNNNQGIVATGLLHGHAGGVVAASIFQNGSGNYGARDGIDTRCVTDFAFGGGYNDLSAADDRYAINAHWWGNGNEYTNDFRAHGLFVR